MVRPCGARGFVDLAEFGLASMYQVSDWSVCSRPSWISARLRPYYRIGLERAVWVTSVRRRWEDRSSISSHPLADLGLANVMGLGHREPPYKGAVPLFVPGGGCSFAPACGSRGASRAGNCQGWPSRWPFGLALVLPGYALTGPSTARRSRGRGEGALRFTQDGTLS
jgi:hypothetical protein